MNKSLWKQLELRIEICGSIKGLTIFISGMNVATLAEILLAFVKLFSVHRYYTNTVLYLTVYTQLSRLMDHTLIPAKRSQHYKKKLVSKFTVTEFLVSKMGRKFVLFCQ